MQCLIVVSFLFLLPAPGAKSKYCACLPKGIQAAVVVSYRGAKPNLPGGKPEVTVEEKLKSLRARCKRGTLVDRSGKPIYFFRLTGCWGNPPEDYQDIMEKQNNELMRLRRRYTVIEMTCNPSGEQIS